MKEYIIAIIGGIFAIVAALVPIILSKRKREKMNSKRSNEFNLNRSDGNTFQVFNGDVGIPKNSHADQLKIEASSKLFELTSKLVKLTTDDFLPLEKVYLKEVTDKYNEFVDFFNSKEYLFNDDVISTLKSIKHIIEQAIKHLKMIEMYQFQGMPTKYIEDEYSSLKEFYIDHMQVELPFHREKLKELVRN